MAAKRDYYEVLGVSKSSSDDEIKRQYRKLALKFHPDRNQSGDAAEHFKEISEAYAVLSDAEKRQLYDQHGHEGVDGRYSREDIFRGAGADFSDVFSGMGGFESIFGSMFGGRSAQQQGSDLLYRMSITLEDVLHGKHVEFELQKQMQCKLCGGSGCKPGTSPKRCASCNGQGRIRQVRNMGFASFATEAPCPQCRGQGSIIESPCDDCGGRGIKKGRKKIERDLPPGLESGDYTLQNEGDEVPGGLNGDLVVRIMVQDHPQFKRDGKDIWYNHHVSMADAALGCEAVVPTLEGDQKIMIPPGTQPNDKIKIKGKGVYHIRSRGRGDQHVLIVVDIPKKLSKHQKNLLDEFRQAGD